MKNYYEILEVNEHASGEIIEKAYNVLVKKYHPDLYTGEDKLYAEQKIKDINEAYKILSNDFLREQYDLELHREKIEKYAQNNIYKVNFETSKKTKTKEGKNNKKSKDDEKDTSTYQVGNIKNIIEISKNIIPDIKKIKNVEKIDVFSLGLTVVIIVILGIILWFVPFTNGWMRQLLFENPISQIIGKLFGN